MRKVTFVCLIISGFINYCLCNSVKFINVYLKKKRKEKNKKKGALLAMGWYKDGKEWKDCEKKYGQTKRSGGTGFGQF